jgi:hypothetical protein
VQPLRQQAPLRRLDEEVGRAGLVGARDRGVVVESGQHQHRHVLEAGARAQPATGVEAVEARHLGVEHDHVRRPAVGQRERLLAARRLREDEAQAAQRGRGQHQVDLVVVDQQHAWRPRRGVGGERRRRHARGVGVTRRA